MHVQSAARHVAVGLGQESRVASVGARHAFHDALEAQRFVADSQRVRRVGEIHLVLAGAVLGERRSRGHVLLPARAVDVGQQRRILVEVGHRVDLRAELAPSRERAFRRLRQPVGSALRVHQIELVLDRDHRRQSEVRRKSPVDSRGASAGRRRSACHRDRTCAIAPAPASGCQGTGTSVPGIGMHGRSASPSSKPRPVSSAVPPSMSSANIEPGSGMPWRRPADVRRGRCACRAPPCSGRSRTRRRTAPSGESPEISSSSLSTARVIQVSGCLLFSTPVQRRARQHMPGDYAPANGPIGQIAPAQPSYRAALA